MQRLLNGRGNGPGLDAEAEVDVRLVAGVGVEVIRRLVVELIAQAKLAAYEQAKGDCAQTGGDPADVLKSAES